MNKRVCQHAFSRISLTLKWDEHKHNNTKTLHPTNQPTPTHVQLRIEIPHNHVFARAAPLKPQLGQWHSSPLDPFISSARLQPIAP
jgi:hypothetical protein